MSSPQEVLKITLRRIWPKADAGVQEDKTKNQRNKKVQRKEHGSGRVTGAARSLLYD